MPDLTGLDGLRDAVEALDAEYVDVERSIQDALSSAFGNRNEDFRAVRSAPSRAASAGIIARVELESLEPWERVASLLAKSAVALSQSGIAGSRLPVRGDPATVADYPEPWPQPSSTTPESPDSGLHWVDPDPYATLTVDRKMLGHILGGRYRLERQLGRGGMGTMYLASDLEAGETPFAVKVLRPEFGSFSEALAMLRAEVRVTRMLRHPHIARVYSLNSDRRDVYLVTEFLQGRTLDAHLLDIGNGLPVNEARPLIDDVCAALAYAHGLEVVHGDLEPAKVFITPSGRAKLLDFGIARAARTRNGRFDPLRVGGLTLAYNSFEMLEGDEPDPRDDVYSLGCLIYTVLSGAHPFDSRTAVEARHLGRAMTPLRVLSRDQNAALARALVFDRAQRTPSVTALLASLGWASHSPAASTVGIATVAAPSDRIPPPTITPQANTATAVPVATTAAALPATAVPTVAPTAPVPSTAVPAAATSVPVPSTAVPTAAPAAPVPSTAVPAAATSVPVPSTAVPAAATSVPVPAAAVPAAAPAAPVPSTAVPAAATSVPVPATAVPAAAPAAPVPATAVPAAATSVPVPATAVPAAAPESAIPESETPAASISSAAPATRTTRRIAARPPLPSIKPMRRPPSMTVSRRVSPRPPLPSIKPARRASPPASVSRRYLMPALIVLSLLAVGIGIAVVYHGHATALFRSRTASARTPAIASGVPAALPPAGPAAIPLPAAPPAVADTKHAAASAPIPVLRPLPTAAAAMADSENCPYPRIAVDQGLTGTVFLLVDVASNGRPQKAKIEKTSGSDALDQAAISCVEQFGRFPASPSGSPSGGYRGRMHITWSFGT